MSSMPQSEKCQPTKRFRFSLRSLFWWQLFLVPFCLGALYARLGPSGDFARFVGMLLAVVCYSALFVCWSTDSLDRRRLPVLGVVYRGALYGGLFGVLLCGPELMPRWIQPLSRLALDDRGNALVRAQPWVALLTVLDALGGLILAMFVFALHFSVLGAATGGVIGLARDMLRRPRVGRTLNPEL